MRDSCFFFLQLLAFVYCLKVGAADYIAVAKNYHTVFISDIPMMSMRIRDKVSYLLLIFAARYVNFIIKLERLSQKSRCCFIHLMFIELQPTKTIRV